MLLKVLLCAIVLLNVAQLKAFGGERQRHGEAKHAQATHQSADPVPGTLPAQTAPAQQSVQGARLDGDQGKDGHEKPKQDQAAAKPWVEAFSPAYWSNGVLAFFALVGGVLAFLTLLAIKKQANLMEAQTALAKHSAEAALLSAQAFINSERPWLLIGVRVVSTSLNDGYLELSVRNTGKSPAKIVFTWDDVRPLAGGEALPPIPGYATIAEKMLHPIWVGPGESNVISQIDGERGTPIEGVTVWVFGVVRYEGTVGSVLYESRFCYEWEVQCMSLGGPPDYNRHT